MGKKLTFEYDKVGDILHIYSVEPYAEQESDELDDEIVARYNPDTGELEGLEVLWFSKRLERDKVLEVPENAFKMAV